MWSSVGRPRSACNTCKGQKIRCSGEHPICNRCSRLGRTCVYKSDAPTSKKLSYVFVSGRTNKSARSPPTNPPLETANGISREAEPVRHRPYSAPLAPSDYQRDSYLGISKSLIYELVEVYFQNAYNASLLLHKGLFLESLAAGTANPHIVLSVCAWAANFYRDQNGQASLRDHGFMIEWAKRAGKLVFQDAESLDEENIVTFCILCLFWYGQGSWRLCYLHKGNACHLLHIGVGGSVKLDVQDSLASEIRRRRLWACYLMHCQMAEPLSLFEPIADIPKLTLPWSEADFDAGASHGPFVCFEDGGNGGGVFAELIKALTLWSSVFSLVKPPETSIGERITGIYALDDDLSRWWQELRSAFKLDPSNIATAPKDRLPNILLINLLYHQSLCALHASIIPLFSWSMGDDSWSSARQSSAQVAFEHACAASALIDGVLSTYNRLSAMHTFIAHTAYSGCAIQIPFMWCLNPAVRERATANVKTNMKMIQAITPYWKFAALLEIHVGLIYKIHQKHARTLEDEPKNMDVRRLLDFQISAAHARTSILGFVEILRSKGDGFSKPGEESNDLGIQDEGIRNLSQDQLATFDNTSGKDIMEGQQGSDEIVPNALTPVLAPTEDHLPNPRVINSSLSQQTAPQQLTQEQRQQELPEQAEPSSYELPTYTMDQSMIDQVSFDVCRPFFDPAMMDLFPDGELPDLSQLETIPWNDLDFQDWNHSQSPSTT